MARKLGFLAATVLLSVTAARAPAQGPSTVVNYLVVTPDSACSRIEGGGLDQSQVQFFAYGWNNGPNAIPQDQSGDDAGLGVVQAAWSIPDTAYDARSGRYALTDSPNGNYGNGWNTWAMIAQSIDLAAAGSCNLVFWHHYALEPNYDYGYVEVNAGSGWNAVATYNGTSGGTADFQYESINLSGYVGQTIDIRFRIATDGSVTSDGWALDDVAVLVDQQAVFSDDFESGLGGWQTLSQWGVTVPIIFDPLGTIDPVTGLFTAGKVTGETYITATYNATVVMTAKVLILPPDWMP